MKYPNFKNNMQKLNKNLSKHTMNTAYDIFGSVFIPCDVTLINFTYTWISEK